MISLIVTVLAIGLVAVLVGATLYYGSSVADEAGSRARAVTLVNQGEQIVAATQIFYTNNSRAPNILQELIDLGYLTTIPVPVGVTLANTSFSIISNAVAEEPGRWTWDAATQTLALVKAVKAESVCAQVNDVGFSSKAVKNAVDTRLRVQCYGAANSAGYTVIWNANTPTDTKASDGAYAVCNGTAIIGHVPAVCGPGEAGTASSLPGSTNSAVEDLTNLLVSLSAGTGLPAGEVSYPYSFDLNQLLSVTGDAAYDASKVVWSVSGGTLPIGLSLESNGVVSGTPSGKNPTGDTFQVLASYKSKSGQQAYTIIVNGAILRVTKIKVSTAHTCAITTAGRVKCWGQNTYGALGNGTTTASLAPVEVSGLTSGVVDLALGGTHTCALLTDGGVKCWGLNASGQLADGTTVNKLAPVSVVGLSAPAVSLVAGMHHNCVVNTLGGVECWGYNIYGQIGDNSRINRTVPVGVSGLTSGVASISSSGSAYSTCAVTTSGGVLCWGNLVSGMALIPTAVPTLDTGVASVSVGADQYCVVTTTGGAKCWGANNYGQLGDNTFVDKLSPTWVFGLKSGVSRVSAGFRFTCALTTAGQALCWGDNASGNLGDGTTTTRRIPWPVSELSSGVTSIVAGGAYACVTLSGDGVRCWGNNYSGQLGDGTTTFRYTPITPLP